MKITKVKYSSRLWEIRGPPVVPKTLWVSVAKKKILIGVNGERKWIGIHPTRTHTPTCNPSTLSKGLNWMCGKIVDYFECKKKSPLMKKVDSSSVLLMKKLSTIEKALRNGTQDDSASGQFLEQKEKQLPILSLLILFLS